MFHHVERLIEEATERGEFDHLPGRGLPIPDLDQPYDAAWWARRFVRRERMRDHADELRRRVRREVPRLLASADPRPGLELLRDEIDAWNRDVEDPDDRVEPLDVVALLERRAARRRSPARRRP